MTKTKKSILVVACAIMLVVMSVMGTMAYLTDTKTVTNTFTVGNVQIELDEAIVDENGNATNDRTEEGEGNEYHLLPGHTYVKDPTVTVKAGSEESYVRMLVTITDFTDVKAVFGDDFLPQYFVDGWDNGKWVTTNTVTVDVENNTATYEFRYYTTVNTVDGGDQALEPLFTHIKVPGEVTNNDLAKLEDMDIIVVAHAIQAYGFNGNADAAWAAFEA